MITGSNEVAPWSKASLRISSGNLAVADITRILSQKPSASFDRGTLTSRRNPRSQVRTENLWILESSLPTGATVLERIDSLMRFLEERIYDVQVIRREASVDIFCGLECGGQASIVLDQSLIQRLAALGVDLVFDLYGEGRANSSEAAAPIPPTGS